VGWQKKHVCGCEAMVAGKSSHTLAFVGWLFLISFFSVQQKFIVLSFFRLAYNDLAYGPRRLLAGSFLTDTEVTKKR